MSPLASGVRTLVVAGNLEVDMELVIWGLLIGMVGMVWLLVAASLQEKGSRDDERNVECEPAPGQDQPCSVQRTERSVKAAA